VKDETSLKFFEYIRGHYDFETESNIDSAQTQIRMLTNVEEAERLFELVNSVYYAYTKCYELFLLEQINALLQSGIDSELITDVQTIPYAYKLVSQSNFYKSAELLSAMAECNQDPWWMTPFKEIIILCKRIVKRLINILGSSRVIN
jgi:hypothetical protein